VNIKACLARKKTRGRMITVWWRDGSSLDLWWESREGGNSEHMTHSSDVDTGRLDRTPSVVKMAHSLKLTVCEKGCT